LSIAFLTGQKILQKEKNKFLANSFSITSSAFGRQAEEIACHYLEKKGYNILRRNFACRFGEIDIIAEKGKTVCFIEVKARTNVSFGPPTIFVTPQKQARIKKTALFFITAKKWDALSFRFDVISITKDKKDSFKIELVEGAFE
jgi:putative endonuclease